MYTELNKKVLVVDDAVTVRMYHRKILEEFGCEVHEAENGIEALEKGLLTPFDLFLVDINMPKMDGYRLVKEMRRSQEMCSIPVIMISTESEKHDQDMGYAAGANFYMVKPSKSKELYQVVKLLLGVG